MAIREGRWMCDTCHFENLGRDKTCQGCGATRPANVTFYLPGNAPPVTDPALLELAKSGQDWKCQHCGRDNKGTSGFCDGCGAASGTSSQRAVQEYSLDEVPHGPTVPPTMPQGFGSSARSTLEINPVSGTGIRWGRVALGLIVALIGILGIVWTLYPKDQEVIVSGFRWERSILTESYRTVREEGWSIPNGGREVSRQQSLHHYDPVLDHYEPKSRQVCENVPDGTKTEYYNDCDWKKTGTEKYVCGTVDLGNGFFDDKECTRDVTEYVCDRKSREVPQTKRQCHDESYQEPVFKQVPVYGTLYSYDIEKWLPNEPFVASGTDHKPVWPTVEFKWQTTRDVSRPAHYVVSLEDADHRQYSYECGLPEWETFDIGQKLKVKVNTLGIVTEVIKD